MTEQSPATKQARYAGQRAYRRGVAFQDNPHPLGSGESRAWSKGWNEKQAEVVATTPETKPCAHCATDFQRGAGISSNRWDKRRFCSRRCAGLSISADPAAAARKVAGIKARYDRPGERERHAERMRVKSKRIWADPEIADRLREASRARVHRTVNSPECRARSAAPDVRARAGASYSRTMLGWCPPERLAEYRRLRGMRFTAAEARRIIEAEIVGTTEHAKRAVANCRDATIIRDQRRRSQEY